VVDRGELLPDGFITQLVARELHARGRGGAILDGYPRTLPQAQDLAVIADVQQVLNLRMPDQVRSEGSFRLPCSSSRRFLHDWCNAS
jgi:adenylate kinase